MKELQSIPDKTSKDSEGYVRWTYTLKFCWTEVHGEEPHAMGINSNKGENAPLLLSTLQVHIFSPFENKKNKLKEKKNVFTISTNYIYINILKLK